MISKVWASVHTPGALAGNLGDRMGHLLANRVGGEGIKLLGIGDKHEIDSSTALLVGSILEHVEKNKSPVIYGPGFITSDSTGKNLLEAEILGVRGHLSAQIIHDSLGRRVPVVGDPGLLLPIFFPRPVPSKRRDVGFIIHGADRQAFTRLSRGLDLELIDNYAPTEKFVSHLTQFRCVYSSSLHGLVFAHSFGVQAVAVKSLSGLVTGGGFKFADYFSYFNLEPPLFNLERLLTRGNRNILRKLIEFADCYPQPSTGQVAQTQASQVSAIQSLFRLG
jgi:pyruvyltransferase